MTDGSDEEQKTNASSRYGFIPLLLAFEQENLKRLFRFTKILEAYYEPQFSEASHGFRPQRGCHSALSRIRSGWNSMHWFTEKDICKYFDRLNHTVILNIIAEKIHDNRFLRLIKHLLQAGYLEDWQYHPTYSGSPQGSIVSPLLSNVLLDKLDKYVETTLIPQYTRGGKRKLNQEYVKLHRQMHKLFKKGQKEAALKIRKHLQQLPSMTPATLTIDVVFRIKL